MVAIRCGRERPIVRMYYRVIPEDDDQALCFGTGWMEHGIGSTPSWRVKATIYRRVLMINQQLSGKTALVIGGASGIGEACAHKFASSGA
jgi:hypothetical protein